MENNNNPIIIKSAESLEAMNRADIDIQVKTAKSYPMHSTPEQITNVLMRVEMFATADTETAESCFYRLERQGKDGPTIIEGPSIRLAEIIASSWGNLRIAAMLIADDGKFITVQGACHDLETNVSQVVPVQRKVTTSKGYRFSDDMVNVTTNAASAIARRNAILAVVPPAIFKPVYKRIKEKAIGQVANNLEQRRANMLKTYALVGVTKEMLCKHINVETVEDMTAEHVVNLLSLWNSLRDGQTTIEETFTIPAKQESMAKQVKDKSDKTKERVAAAMAGAQAQASGDDLPPANVDMETGEMFPSDM